MLKKSWDDWWESDYDNTVIRTADGNNDIIHLPIRDYLVDRLCKEEINFFDIDSEEFRSKGLYMSGTDGMLPTVFDVPPVDKKDKIHQAEKPLELLEQIIAFVTKPNEKILDQFAGSGVVGEAALNTGRDSVLIEKDIETYEIAAVRLGRRR